MKITEWFEKNYDRNSIFFPPMKAEMFIDYIKDYLLDEDWYCINPVNAEQVYTEILFQVLEKYSKKYKKEQGYKKCKERLKNITKALDNIVNELFRMK